MEKTKKGDFIAFEFIASMKDGEVFDTNVEAEAKKLGYKEKVKPSIICIGQKMVVQGLDNALEDKEIGKDYSVDLTPKEAFGNRDSSLIKTYPLKAFHARNINPTPGMVLALDNTLAKVISASGGRVILDLNNPLAGKNVVYKFKIIKKIDKIEEKAEALRDFLYNQPFELEIKEKELIIKAPKPFEKFILIYKDKFKEILGLDLKFQASDSAKVKKEDNEQGHELAEIKKDKKEEKAEKKEEKTDSS